MINLSTITEWIDAVADSIVDIGQRIRLSDLADMRALKSHLRVSRLDDVIDVSSMLSNYQRHVQMASFYKFVDSAGYEVDHTANFGLDGYRETVFEHFRVEIDPDKFEKCPGWGYLFLVHKDGSKKLVVKIEDEGFERHKLQVFARSEDREVAESFLSGLREYSTEHNVFKGKRITPSLSHVKVGKEYKWNSVILPKETKAELVKNLDLLFDNVELYRTNKLTFKRGLILKGPPGTGKTLIGKVLCSSSHVTTFIWVTPGDLVESRKIRIICELARELSPTILFLEDVDLYGSHREKENRGVLGELMNQLDGLTENEFIAVVATTNNVDEVEDALRNRPGRFDRIIDVGLPDHECRSAMFRSFLSEINVEVENFDKLLDILSEKTDGFTGAHVKELVNSAIMSAIEDKSYGADKKIVVKVKHFQDNIEVVRTKKIQASVGFLNETKKPLFDPREDWDLD